MFATVRDLLAAEAATRKVQLAIGDVTGTVTADPAQLQQVLVNLVLNALDACAAHGRVELRARPAAAEGVALEVADDGHGIATADRAHIFDPFYTTKKRGRGTGLGLLGRRADRAHAHGAEIELDTAPGRGTTVRLVLARSARQ